MAERSVRRQLGSIILAFEAFIVFFGTLVAFGLKVADPKLVWGFGLAFSTILILTPGYLGRKGSYWFAWALQITLLVVSFFVPWMLLISIIFVGLFGWSMIAGATIDLAKKAKANLDSVEVIVESKEK